MCRSEGFTLPCGLGSRESRRRGDCLRLSRPAYKKTPREMERVIEPGRGREKEGSRIKGHGEGGEGSERRRTMRLLMRPFWGAYVGHGMNKQTFTTLNWWFTHTQPHAQSHVVLFMFAILPFTHRLSHITLIQTRTHTHTQTEPRCLVFIVYASPFHSFMDVVLSCPVFKSLGLLRLIKFALFHTLHSCTHTHTILPPGSLSYSLAMLHRRISCNSFEASNQF